MFILVKFIDKCVEVFARVSYRLLDTLVDRCTSTLNLKL